MHSVSTDPDAAAVRRPWCWTAPLFALATAHWAWLVHGARLAELILANRTAGNDLRALHADLMQVRILVQDAAVTLGNGFQGLSEAMRREHPAAADATGMEVAVSAISRRHRGRRGRSSCSSAGIIPTCGV